MRLLLGIVLGVFLTIGSAYVYDASTASTAAPSTQAGVEGRPMVNWDVVRSNWHGWSSDLRSTWHRLASR
jgi:hypothetical protein